jgi:hypothetical protein
MKIYLGALLLLLLIFSGPATAAIPELETGVLLQDGSNDLTVSLMANPFVVDWNDDGAKDLLVGQFIYGNIALYLNQGSDFKPQFNGSTLIKSNGVNITTTYG